jgi:hypothetical protein
MNQKQADQQCQKPEPDLGPGKDGFYEKSVDRFTSWVQYEDAKAGAVLVLLGLGLTDVLGNAGRLINAYHAPPPHDSSWGWVASIAFWAAIVTAGCAVGAIAIAVWPYTGRRRRCHPFGSSLFYFNAVAEWHEYRGVKVLRKKASERAKERATRRADKNAKALAEYQDRVREASEEELERDMAEQALILANAAANKVKLVKIGFWLVTVFLFAWAAARIALGFA